MANVSVEKEAIAKSIAICNRSIQQHKQTITFLGRKYRETGTRWNDNKYVQLGRVLNDCAVALNTPLNELENCITTLNEIMKAIEKYESENF